MSIRRTTRGDAVVGDEAAEEAEADDGKPEEEDFRLRPVFVKDSNEDMDCTLELRFMVASGTACTTGPAVGFY